MTDHSQDFADGIALPSRGIFPSFERKVTKLRPFVREIPQMTQHRFHDLLELFERPLCEYLIKAKVNPNPISIKLRVLGESEATAKPWIVVSCDKAASRKIRQFFSQTQIKAEYQPSKSDASLPSFEIFVQSRPPRPMGGTEIYGDDDERSTMCGRIIKIGEAQQSRFATIGGVIKYVFTEQASLLSHQKVLEHISGVSIVIRSRLAFTLGIGNTDCGTLVRVVKPPGIVALYGMTAGHIIAQQPLEGGNLDPVNVQIEEEEEDEGFYSGEEEYELDGVFESDEEVQDSAITGERTQTASQSTPFRCRWPKIGDVSAVSTKSTRTGHDLDWALIEFGDPTDIRPNLIAQSDRVEEPARNRPLKENGKFTEDGSSRTVFLLSGTGGVKSGTLSTSLSFLMMGPAKAFTKTYTLALPNGSGNNYCYSDSEIQLMLLVLNAGDCGSWVIDPLTCEVYQKHATTFSWSGFAGGY